MKSNKVKSSKCPEDELWNRLLNEAKKSRNSHIGKQIKKSSAAKKSNGNKEKHENERNDLKSTGTFEVTNNQSKQSGLLNLPKIDRELLLNSINSNRIGNQSTSQGSNSIMNNPKINQVIDEIRNQITAHLNNQPFYKEQELKRKEREEKLCRICFATSEDERLLKVCKCSGTMACVHLTCLKSWVETNRSGFCNICRKKYKGINVTLRYPPFLRWVKSDLKSIQTIFWVLILLAFSFTLYTKRAFEFYAREYHTYKRQMHFVRSENLKSEDLTLFDVYKNQTCYSRQSLGPDFRPHFNKTKFSAITRTPSNTHQLSHHSSSTVSSHFQMSNQFDHFQGNNQADLNEQFILSVTIYFWYILLYVLNDLLQIMMYPIVLRMFYWHFVSEYRVWQYFNMIPIIEIVDNELQPYELP